MRGRTSRAWPSPGAGRDLGRNTSIAAPRPETTTIQKKRSPRRLPQSRPGQHAVVAPALSPVPRHFGGASAAALGFRPSAGSGRVARPSTVRRLRREQKVTWLREIGTMRQRFAFLFVGFLFSTALAGAK